MKVKYAKSINLLPATYVAQCHRQRITAGAFIFLVLLAGALTLTAFFFGSKTSKLHEQQTALQRRVQELQSTQLVEQQLQEETLRQERRRDFLQEHQAAALQPLPYLAEIEVAVPSGTVLYSLSLDGTKLLITGVTEDLHQLPAFLGLLQEGLGTDLRLSNWELQEDGRYRFQLQGEVPALK